MSNTKLLADTRHLLVSLSGLKAFDSLGERVTSSDSHVSVNISDLIPLDFRKEIQLIDDALKLDGSIDDPVMDNLCEWSQLVTELSEKEIKLYQSKEAYIALSDTLLEQAKKDKEEDKGDIIKDLYGYNNDKTRSRYVKDELKDEDKDIKDLEFSIDYLKRRISYLKSLIRTKTVLMEIKE